MEEAKQRKQDLEDEMNRFEQEISTNLPPPPHIATSQQRPSYPPHPPTFRPPPLRGMPTFPGLPPMPPPPMFGQPMSQMDGMPPGLPPMPPMDRMPGMPPLPPGLPGMPPMMGMGPPGMMGMPPMPPPNVPGPPPPQINTSTATSAAPWMDPPIVPLRNYDGGTYPPTTEDEKTQETDYTEYTEAESSSSSASNFNTDGSSGAKGGGGGSGKGKKSKKKVLRVAGGVVWDDETLLEWDVNDFRIFVGDLGNEVSDDALLRAFSAYPSLLKAKVIRDKKTKKTKGFGFVSFKDPKDYLRAMREMNGKYVGNRPIKLRKSSWKDRNINIAKKKEKEKKKLGLR